MKKKNLEKAVTLPSKYKILPEIIELKIHGFDKDSNGKTLSIVQQNSNDWFNKYR